MVEAGFMIRAARSEIAITRAVRPQATPRVKKGNMVDTSSSLAVTTPDVCIGPHLERHPGSRKKRARKNAATQIVTTISSLLKTSLNLFVWSSWLNSVG